MTLDNTTPRCVPGASPSTSPAGRTPASRVVRPPVPLPTGTDHRDPVRGTHHQVRPEPGTDPHTKATR